MASKTSPQRKLKVLWLTKGLNRGGVEQLLVNLAKFRDRERFDYSLAFIAPQYSDLLPTFRELGLSVSCLSSTGRDTDLRWLLGLRRLLMAENFDIVHMHLRYPATFARPIARSLPRGIARPKLVFTEHNVWGHDVLVTRLTNAATYWLDDANLAVSSQVWRSMPAWAQRRTQVLVHGLDPDEIAAARGQGAEVRRELGIEPNDIVVGTVANFRPQKGYEVFIEAASRIAAAHPQVRFVAVGQGTQQEQIIEMIEQRGLTGRFLLTGDRPDAVRVASCFDVFTMASHFEGFPVAVMEALALGLPVVATAVGGIPEAITDGVEGLLVPRGDGAALAEAIGRLVVDDSRRIQMSAAARKAGSSFDIRRASRSLELLYGGLAG